MEPEPLAGKRDLTGEHLPDRLFGPRRGQMPAAPPESVRAVETSSLDGRRTMRGWTRAGGPEC
jgi:hypothetical protein